MKQKSFKELIQAIKDLQEGKGRRRVWLINPKTRIKESKKLYSRKKLPKVRLSEEE